MANSATLENNIPGFLKALGHQEGEGERGGKVPEQLLDNNMTIKKSAFRLKSLTD